MALFDALACYLHLLNPSNPIFEADKENPKVEFQPVESAKIVMMGDSCGGNLVMSLMALIRNELGSLRISDPESLVLLSPWVLYYFLIISSISRIRQARG
jgi:hypothetical protein